MLPAATDSWLIVLVPLSLAMGVVGLLTFMWCIRNRQFEDMEGDAVRILMGPDTPEMPKHGIARAVTPAPIKPLTSAVNPPSGSRSMRHSSIDGSVT